MVEDTKRSKYFGVDEWVLALALGLYMSYLCWAILLSLSFQNKGNERVLFACVQVV